MKDFGDRLHDALAGTPLADRIDLVRDPLVMRRGGDAAAAALDGPALVGLARIVAVSIDDARFLAHRPALLERLAAATGASLSARRVELAAAGSATPVTDLEGALDALRLLRRDESLFAAALELGGLAPFAEVSTFLSELAEAVLAGALRLAEGTVRGAGGAPPLAVLGMGKIGGREFTFHSDLDLIFLCSGGAEALAHASRVAQRLISYLATRTGAGVAYAVDSRLRPSGNQGLLVTTHESFARYQREDAQTWEHLALQRARGVAGDVASAQETLRAVRATLRPRGGPLWADVADMRRKVEAQRGQEPDGKLALKTGPGGLMDVDFLAAGAALERRLTPFPPFPGNGALLRAAAPGAGTEALLASYDALRAIEARARLATGRALEVLETGAESYPLVAAVCVPGLPPEALRARLDAHRRSIRAAFRAVASAESIGALGA